MALTDPAALTYSGAAKSLALIGRDENSATYKLVDSGNVSYTLLISHEFRNRNKCTIRIVRDALVSDPLVTGQSQPSQVAITVTANWGPLNTPADVQSLYAALLTFATSAIFLRVAGGET